MGNTGTEDLLLCIVQFWCTSTVDEDNWTLTMVIYCSVMMNTYYSFLGFIPIKHNEEVKDICEELFNSVPHLIYNFICVNCLKYGFVI